MKKYGDLSGFLKFNIPFLILCIVLNALPGIFKSVGAVYLGSITNSLAIRDAAPILGFVIIGGGLTFASYAVRWLGAVAPRFLMEKFAFETRLKMFEHLSKIPFLTYEGYPLGQMQSIIQSDSVKAGQIFYTVISRILNNIFLFIFSVIVMARSNAAVTAITVVIVIAATAINQAILKRMKRFEKAAQQNLGEMSDTLESVFSSIETVKTAGAGTFALSQYTGRQRQYCENRLTSTRIGAIRSLWYALTEHLCLYGSVVYLGMLGIQGVMSVGDVIMFIYLIKQIIMPIEVVFRWMSSIPMSNASRERILDVLGVEKEPEAAAEDIINLKRVDIDNLNFAYGDNAPTLNNVNFSLEANKVSALLGTSGTGKTTLLKVLMGLYHADNARIRADGRIVSTLKSNVAYAALENSVFPMSVYDNVAIGNSAVKREDVVKILEDLGFGDWLKSLPEGIDTIIKDDVSGGQKQAISNARILLSDKRILIFDEPFSALDTEKEACLARVLNNKMKDGIVLLTSHRKTDYPLIDETILLA